MIERRAIEALMGALAQNIDEATVSALLDALTDSGAPEYLMFNPKLMLASLKRGVRYGVMPVSAWWPGYDCVEVWMKAMTDGMRGEEVASEDAEGD